MADGAKGGAISVRGVEKRFGSMVALAAFDLDLPAGSLFSLLGPSGCGKTTLMRIIAGLEEPDGGAVILDGEDITRAPPERRPFNMVFQRYALFPHLTVFDNLAFGLTTDRAHRAEPHKIEERVNDCLRLVGLTGFEKRYPSQLSGGQQQRVALARAIVRRPRALLLDEPMSALDRNVRIQVREELLRIHRELGTTFLLVTHDQEEALSVSDRVALMNNGRLVQQGKPEELYRRPRTLFAARFVGAGSLIAATLGEPREGAAEVSIGGIRFRTTVAEGVAAGPVTLLLRPEELIAVAPGAGRIEVVVETAAFMGSHYDLTASSPVGPLRLTTARAIAPGERIDIDWPDMTGIAYPLETS